MKRCSQCHEEKALDEFSPNKGCKDGRTPKCKACSAENVRKKRAENLERFRMMERDRYARNPEAKKKSYAKYYNAKADDIRARNVSRYKAKASEIKEKCAEYRKNNKAKVFAWNGTRRATIRGATPKWADRAKIASIYEEALKLSRKTGVKHHVDHVIPLSGKNVCGLHVPENLQVIEATANLSKGNRFG